MNGTICGTCYITRSCELKDINIYHDILTNFGLINLKLDTYDENTLIIDFTYFIDIDFVFISKNNVKYTLDGNEFAKDLLDSIRVFDNNFTSLKLIITNISGTAFYGSNNEESVDIDKSVKDIFITTGLTTAA